MKHRYSLQELNEVVEGVFSGVNLNARISRLLLDSRKVAYLEGTLFFAIKGLHHDGHRFIPDLYEKGIRHFVVTRLPENRFLLEEANFLIVKDTMKALQEIAAYHRSKFKIPTIGITGSNGKTIVKEWLNQLLKDDFEVVRSPKSYNSQIGVPLSVWQIDQRHEIALVEAGISQMDEMEKLEAVIKPTIGVFTNIGHAHGQHFAAKQEKVDEKLKLFKGVETLVYCLDHKMIHESIMNDESLKSAKKVTWSRYHQTDVFVEKIEKSGRHVLIELLYKKETYQFQLPFTDEASVENILHCITLSLNLGIDPDKLLARVHNLNAVAMRLELKEGINNCSVINDAYSSDLESLQIALEFMGQQKQSRKRTVVLSDLLQTGRMQREMYEDVALLLKRNRVDRLIGIGNQISRFPDLFPMDSTFYAKTEDFLSEMSQLEFRDEIILIKGARAFHFEDISQILEQKAHQTVLEINLNALVHNLNTYRAALKPETKIMCMVKAFSYGSGSYEIANVLQFHRVNYLGVAFADEGLELRKAGITLPIMVMNPDESSFDSMTRYELEPEIYSLRALNLFEEAISYRREPEVFYIHLKLDTGMHRLGFQEEEIEGLLENLKDQERIKIRSIFSHLAAADDPKEKEFTLQQIESFKKMSRKIMDEIDYPIDRHILNSSGIEHYSEHQFDMVRLGIGLYGVGSFPELMSVSRLKTTISQIKEIKKGHTVGYGRTFKAEEDMRIATLPIGYADGLNRKLGNGRSTLLIKGVEVPIIGTICMDMCFIDVSKVTVKEGDEVIIFGPEKPMQEMAKSIDTIPYEVLTSISRRVKRVYYQE